jgi:hypothetical protein
MEQLRLASPTTPALAASGGSLLCRIRRLLEGSTPGMASSRWAAGLLLAAGASIFIASVHWAQSPGSNPNNAGGLSDQQQDTIIEQFKQTASLSDRFESAQRKGKAKR